MADETRDRGSKDSATRADHPRRFSQTQQAVLTIGQVVQRAEEQRNVEGIIFELKITSIADIRLECALAFGLLHLSRNRVDQDHVMTQFSQGCGMNASRAPHIEDLRVRTDTAGNQFLDALELQTALSRTHGQALRLREVLCVVVLDASVHVPLVHSADSRRPPWQVALSLSRHDRANRGRSGLSVSTVRRPESGTGDGPQAVPTMTACG